VQYWTACVVGLQAHFSRGLSIGTEDFSIDDFDPCRKWWWPRCLKCGLRFYLNICLTFVVNVLWRRCVTDRCCHSYLIDILYSQQIFVHTTALLISCSCSQHCIMLTVYTSICDRNLHMSVFVPYCAKKIYLCIVHYCAYISAYHWCCAQVTVRVKHLICCHMKLFFITQRITCFSTRVRCLVLWCCLLLLYWHCQHYYTDLFLPALSLSVLVKWTLFLCHMYNV